MSSLAVILSISCQGVPVFREKGGGVGTRHQVAGRGILRCAGEVARGQGAEVVFILHK